MYKKIALTLAFVAILSSSPALRAQRPADPSGHWEGALHAPNMEVAFAIDVAKRSDGSLQATFTSAARKIKGFPLTKASVDGRIVRFVLSATTGGGTFEAKLEDEGRTMTGEYVMAASEGGYRIPFDLKRTGEAQFETIEASAPIGQEFEGVWSALLETDGRMLRFVLKLSNQAGGGSATIVSVDRDNAEFRASRVTQAGTRLTLDLKALGASYEATLSGDATELVGTYREGDVALPLTFRRPRD